MCVACSPRVDLKMAASRLALKFSKKSSKSKKMGKENLVRWLKSKCVWFEREMVKRSSRCTDQLSKSMDKSLGIKDLSWGIEKKLLRPLAIRSGSKGMTKVINLRLRVIALYEKNRQFSRRNQVMPV
jgi:hypothetical protein